MVCYEMVTTARLKAAMLGARCVGYLGNGCPAPLLAPEVMTWDGVETCRYGEDSAATHKQGQLDL